MIGRAAFATTTLALLAIATLARADAVEPVLYLRGAAYPESVLTTEPPQAEVLANLDRGRNEDPGLTLESGGSGRREFDDARFQDFLIPADGIAVTGPITLVVWVAAPTPEPDLTVVVRARIHDCNGFGFGCADVASGEATLTLPGHAGFVPLEIPIPLDGHSWAADRTLELRLLADTSSGGPIWIGYDALETPSALRVGQLTTTTTTTQPTTTMPSVTTTTSPPPPVHVPTTVTTAALTTTTSVVVASTTSSSTAASPTTTTMAPSFDGRLDSLVFDLSPPGGGDSSGSRLRANGIIVATFTAGLLDLWPWIVAMGVLTAVAFWAARTRREAST